MKLKFKHLGVIAAGLLAANAMACYTVYDRSNRIAYQGEDPPVDMRLPLHLALQSRYPGGHMVFEQTAECRPISLGALARPGGPAVPPNTIVFDNGRERRVAVVPTSSMTASRTVVPNTATMGAGPATYGMRPNTAVMGAAPSFASVGSSTIAPRSLATSATSPLLTDKRTADSMGLPYTTLSGNIVVVPAKAAATVDFAPLTVVPSEPISSAPRMGSDTVITELHNPPLTVTQRGGETVINRY